MTFKLSSVLAWLACATSATLACSGKLKVGDEVPTAGSAGVAGADEAGGENDGGPASGGVGAGGIGTGGAKTSSGGGGVTGVAGARPVTGGFGGAPGSGTGGVTASGGRTEPSTGGVAFGGNFDFGNGGMGNQTWVDEIEPTPPFDGSSDDCPLGPVHPEGECDGDGLICGYLYEDHDQNQGYQECACTRIVGGGLAWNCYPTEGGPSEQCPSEPPTHGSDCFGYFSLYCSYPPRIDCFCDSELETWSCPTEVREVPEYQKPPSDPDPELTVAELSDDEREAWCTWYAYASTGPGFPAPQSQPVDDLGYVHPGCGFEPYFCSVGVPALSVEQCVANLRLSTCASPLSNLSECVSMVRSGTCGPFDYGCLDYRDTPDCINTIVVNYGVSECRIRVE